jgi:hypothetical protein
LISEEDTKPKLLIKIDKTEYFHACAMKKIFLNDVSEFEKNEIYSNILNVNFYKNFSVSVGVHIAVISEDNKILFTKRSKGVFVSKGFIFFNLFFLNIFKFKFFFKFFFN